MNLKSSLRRTAVLTAGALIGLSGAFALTGPASAHHPIFKSNASCVNDDGTWQVNWTIGNSERYKVGTITDVVLWPEGTSITNVQKGAVLPKAGSGEPELQGVQTLGKDHWFAKIQVGVQWDGAFKTDSSDKIYRPKQKCDGPTKPPTTPPTTTPPVTTPPATTPPATTPPTTPPTTAPVTTPPATTPPATPEPSTSVPTSPVTEPEYVYDPTCDSVTVGITVPEDWKDGDITVVFTTSKGDSKKIVGKVGETTTVEFPATDGMTVTAAPEGFEDEGATLTYEKPENCDTAGGGGSSEDEDGPTLPLTGAAAGSIAGGAGLLLAVGAGLFFMARRRKVNFTA